MKVYKTSFNIESINVKIILYRQKETEDDKGSFNI